MAELHDALAAYPDNDRVAALERPSEPLTARITSWLDSGAEHLPATARDTLRRLVVGAPPNRLPMLLVHGDFRSANILYAGAEVAATLDFEEAGFDHRVVELARSAVMLGTRFRNWGPVSGEVRAEFLSGYQCARQLTPVEAGWWDALVLWHALALVPPGGDPTGWAPSALSHLARPGEPITLTTAAIRAGYGQVRRVRSVNPRGISTAVVEMQRTFPNGHNIFSTLDR